MKDTNSKEYSLFALLDDYYNAKKQYYEGARKVKLTDREFDCLEESIIAIHGIEALYLDNWGCVGYDVEKHDTIRRRLNAIS